MKYTLEIHHYYPASLNSGHPEHDLRCVLKANTLWSLLRQAKSKNLDAEFFQAINRYRKN